MIEYGTGGQATNAIRLTCAEMGFVVGISVAMKKEPDRLFKIIDMDDNQVRLREVNTSTGSFLNKTIVVTDYQKFLQRYSKAGDVEMMKGWPGNSIVGSDALQLSVDSAHCLVF